MAHRTSGRSADEIVATLADLSLFASLTDGARASIANRFERIAFERDEVIVFEGAPPDWLYVVLDGFVKLVKHSDDGREIILHVATRGDMIGGVSAFGRRPHPFTAQAMVPSVALRAAGPDFAALMKDHPDVASQTVTLLIDELTEAHETAKSLATERVERRIARQLVKLTTKLGRPTPGGVEIAVPLARQDVADLAGTTVESAIRVLSRWRRAGLVRTVDGRLVVEDMARVRALAEEPL